MIWNDPNTALNLELETLAAHIAAEIQSAAGGNPENADKPESREIAASVAEFVLHSGACIPSPVNNPGEARASERGAGGGIMIPSDYLLIMTCRALWSVGREQVAMKLLRSKAPELNIPESYANAIFGRWFLPCLATHSVLARALKPSSSAWSMNGQCWILNLRFLFSFLETGLELTIWRILHALIKEMAVLWDASGGMGAMGLKNTCYLSVNVLGFPGKSRKARKFAAELISFCEKDLKMTAEKRNWRSAPTVMDVDA